MPQVLGELSWKRGPDMLFDMGDSVHSVVLQEKVYVGGGLADYGSDANCIVMEYDTLSAKWARLTPYRAHHFTMTVIKNQLVLVGGVDYDRCSELLGVWRAMDKQWTHPYQEMPTARSASSALVFNKWLVVAGGWGSSGVLSSVEAMNIDNKQWYNGPPTPTPWHSMKTAIVMDTCYFMGGNADIKASYSCVTKVYCVSLPVLTSQLDAQDSSEGYEIWKWIPGLSTTRSAPLSIGGSLFAVGGVDEGGDAVTTIHLYKPDMGEWVNVGDLPTARYDCACAMIRDKEMIVAGGDMCPTHTTSRMDMAFITTNTV